MDVVPALDFDLENEHDRDTISGFPNCARYAFPS